MGELVTQPLILEFRWKINNAVATIEIIYIYGKFF